RSAARCGRWCSRRARAARRPPGSRRRGPGRCGAHGTWPECRWEHGPMAPASARRRTPVVIVIAALAVIALVVGGVAFWRSTADDGTDAAEQLAGTLAEGGSDLDAEVLGALRDTGATAEAALADAGDAEDGTRTATYDWTWTLPDDAGTWEYSTTATLTKGEDGWAPQLTPAALGPELEDGEMLAVRAVDPELGTITDRDGTQL